MKKTFLLLALALGFFNTATAVATPIKPSEKDFFVFQLGVSGSWINYIEPGFVSFYGMMYGLDSVMQFNYDPAFDLRVESTLQYGNIQYDGSVKDTTTQVVSPLKAGAYDYIFSTRVKPEFIVANAGSSDFYLNFGLGFRYLNDRVNSSSGYQREISYVFLPLGGRMETKISPTSLFGADLEYDFFLVGKVKSHLSDTNASNPDVTNTQSSGYGIRAILEYRFLAGGAWFSVKPYFQWWNVGASDAAPYTQGLVLVEPQNSSSNSGIIFSAEL